MNRKSIPATIILAIFATCALGWNLLSEGLAQQANIKAPLGEPIEPARPSISNGEEGDAPAVETNWPYTLRMYKDLLQRAGTDAERENVQQDLRKVVNSAFEADLQARQEEIEEFKQRIATLEAILEKRRQEKQNIIELQIKTLQNEADGLGFSTDSLGDARRRSGAAGQFGQIRSSSRAEDSYNLPQEQPADPPRR